MKKPQTAPRRPARSTSGKGATAEGIGTRACAEASHAEGVGTRVEDDAAYGKVAAGGHAEGRDTRSTGWQAHAEGSCCWAEGLISHAENCITLAAGNDSHAEGVQTVTGRRRYFIRPEDQGVRALDGRGATPFFIVRADPALCPDGDVTREFVDRVIPSIHGSATGAPLVRAPIWHRHNTAVLFGAQEGVIARVTVIKSVFEPGRCWTTVFYDHPAETFPLPDRIMMACASYAPEGGDTTYSDGKGQHAEGKRTNAAGNFAHAEGRDTSCFGRYSHAEGYRTSVTGQFGAHGEGHGTTAAGDFAHAEGSDTLASGSASHAEGCRTVAAGECSHAAGCDTQAQGDCAAAMGRDTRALHPGAVITGRHGSSDTAYAWHLAGGTRQQPALRARIDPSGGYHASRWAAGGGNFAQRFDWADDHPGAEDPVGLFVSLNGERLVLAAPTSEYVLGIVTADPAFLAGENPFSPRPRAGGPQQAAVALLGRAVARDDGTCRANGYCRPGPGGVAVAAPQGYRVLRRLSEQTIEVILK